MHFRNIRGMMEIFVCYLQKYIYSLAYITVSVTDSYLLTIFTGTSWRNFEAHLFELMFRNIAKVENKRLLDLFFECLREVYPLDAKPTFDFPENRPIYTTYNPQIGTVSPTVSVIIMSSP